MKRTLLALITLSLTISTTMAMNFDEAFKQSGSKPMALLLYADWADNAQEVSQAFSAAEPMFANKYNFVKLNIANKDAKSFNKIYSIMPNLPYVMLFRDGTKFSRMVKSDCVMNSSCFSDKLNAFTN